MAALSASKPGTRTRQRLQSTIAPTTLSTDMQTSAEVKSRTNQDAAPKRWTTASSPTLQTAQKAGKTRLTSAELSWITIAELTSIGRLPKRTRSGRTLVFVA